ncbi:hypothetical protein [Micromonospora chersina]|uniref:hypothetical protein n=1 Tax=Micromonospora chersina TaxID=47854 RepID=UPI0033B18BBD
MASRVIDLDAARREALGEPDPIRVILMRQEWKLPAELPAAVLDPLFEGELDDLIALLVDLLGEGDGEGLNKDDVDFLALVRRVAAKPQLVSATLRALRGCFEQLLGPEQWQKWLDARPGLNAYLLLGKTAWAEYGVSLGGSIGLALFLRRRWEDVEADLAGRDVDARRIWLPAGHPQLIGLRRARVLLRSPPPDAACKQPREGRQPWSTSDELLALVLEELSVLASGLRTELRTAVKEAAAKSKVAASIGVTITASELRRAVKEAAAKAKAKAKIAVDVSATQLRRQVAEAAAKAKPKVRVDADTKPAVRAIEGLNKVKATLKADTKDFTDKLKKAASQAAGLAAIAAKSIALARVDIPPSTGAITEAMIKDLRRVANPRRERTLLTSSPGANNDLTSTSAYVDWPAVAVKSIAVPSWATQVKIVSTIAGALASFDLVDGFLRHRLGAATFGQETRFDTNGVTASNQADKTMLTADTLTVPASMRGTKQQVAVQGKLTLRGSSGNGLVRAYTSTTIVTDIEFLEVAA